VSQDQKGAGEKTGGSKTGDGSADDESHRIWGNTAYQTTNFKDEDGGQVDPFDAEKRVEFSEQ
jgi:hypothetical protein